MIINDFETFQQARGQDWSHITRSRRHADQVLQLLGDALKSYQNFDISCVFFGSLARREWTNGSDVDWTLLVDGQADAAHYKTAQAVARSIAKVEFMGQPLQEPGASGLFGNLTFSHQLVHKLGGEEDTNLNTTRRILLLLESVGLQSTAHARTVRALLDRYLKDDFRFDDEMKGRGRVPRFLLNDIFRFWRTLCVDYGMKRWVQSEKWALRNVKLRMSRKWLIVSGILTMFACECGDDEVESTERTKDATLSVLAEYAALTPADIIARELTRIGMQDQAASLFDIYDHYLSKLDNPELREDLRKLTTAAARRDRHFKEFKELGREFQDVLKQVFFEQDEALSKFTKEYGVF